MGLDGRKFCASGFRTWKERTLLSVGLPASDSASFGKPELTMEGAKENFEVGVRGADDGEDDTDVIEAVSVLSVKEEEGEFWLGSTLAGLRVILVGQVPDFLCFSNAAQKSSGSANLVATGVEELGKVVVDVVSRDKVSQGTGRDSGAGASRAGILMTDVSMAGVSMAGVSRDLVSITGVSKAGMLTAAVATKGPQAFELVLEKRASTAAQKTLGSGRAWFVTS